MDRTELKSKEQMRPQLTQYLLDKGYVTEEQCAEALQRQVIFGGKLGTNLLELFYIDETQFLEGLSHVLRIPVADPELLEDVPSNVIEAFPQTLVEKFQVLPMEMPKGRIHLAMIDPKDMNAINEIEFITGRVVKPFVTSELNMGFLLEKYYGITRDRRFVSIPEEELRRRRTRDQRNRTGHDEKEKAAAPATGNQMANTTSSVATPSRTFGTEEAITADATTLKGVSELLAEAQDRDHIASTLLTFSTVNVERSILFFVEEEEVYAWKTAGLWKNPENMRYVRFPRTTANVIQEVAQSNTPSKGSLERTEIHEKMIECLGPPYPKEIVAFPLAIHKKVFAVLYADNGVSGDKFKDLTELAKACLKAALAFEILVLKAKIRFPA